MAIDKKLRDTEFIKQFSWGKIVTYLKKQFDQWAIEQLNACGYKDFKIVYMPVIMNIDLAGTNNNDLAKRARVSKQAMSKVIKELQQLGYIVANVDPDDKRSTVFTLTEKGKKFVLDARNCVLALMNDYRKQFGKSNFDGLVQQLLQVIEYNDSLLNGHE